TVLLAIACLTDAQNNPAQEKKPAPATATPAPATDAPRESRLVVTNGPAMKVTVLDAATGRPLSGAAVLAPNWAAYWGGKENAPRWLTDSNGVAMVRLGETSEGHLNQRAWFTVSARSESYAP